MILYRTAGAWGPGTGANLSAAQVDANFFDLASRLQFIELYPSRPVQITSFNAIGNLLYIYMSDGSVQGPLTLPTVRWYFRGPWTPGTNYALNDVVTGPDGAVYLVMFGHQSGASFDPGANDGAGNDFYVVLMQVPAAVLPPGGGAGYVLTKNTLNSYDVAWEPTKAPPGGNTGEVLQKNSEFDGDTSWNFLQLREMEDVLLSTFPTHGDYLRYDASVSRWVNAGGTIQIVLRASSWAPVLGDNGAFMVLTNGTADATVFIPLDDDQNFPIGTELTVHQDGTGKVTIVGDSGQWASVTILKHASFSNQLLGQYATATCKKTGVNEWRLFGLLAGA